MHTYLVRYTPSWLPGAGFKRQALSWKKRFDSIMDIPFTWAKNQIVSFFSAFLIALSPSPYSEDF